MSGEEETEYPLGGVRRDLVTTPSGLGLDDLTLPALRKGRLSWEDLRATPATLRRQAQVAHRAGRTALGDNLMRAAELASVPNDVILEIYTALRPHRSTPEELEGWASRLEQEFSAPRTAAFVREAAAVYRERALLRSGEHAAF